MDGIQLPNLRKSIDILAKHKVILVSVLIIITIAVTGGLSLKKVNIVADGNNYTIITFYSSPEKILAQAGISLDPNDEFRMITKSGLIEVFRAVPVTVKFKDHSESLITGKPTVGELVASMGFTAQNSQTAPDPETRITPSMEIRVISVAEKTVTQKMPISAPVIRQPDGKMEKNEEQIERYGSEGLKEVLIKQRFEDGIQVAANIIAEKVITEAIPQIVRVGTRNTVETSRGSMTFRDVHRMQATAYTPWDGSSSGITASGIKARRGIVAVDPNVIPLGTRLFIPGYGLAVAADTGGSIIGSRIDLCMESRNEALSFGRRWVKVYIIAQ